MKYFITFIFVLVFFTSNISFSQIGHFDSASVLVSSLNYDYKNPTYYKLSSPINYFIRDCMLVYERWSTQNESDVVARLMTYNSLSPEVIISDSGYINKNPTVGYFEYLPQDNEGIVLYQTNRNSNWDIYYSKFNGTSWSSTVPLVNSPLNESDPFVYVYRNSTFNNYLVIFSRGGDIIGKNYFNGSWLSEINLTSDINDSCSSPRLLGDLGQISKLAYLVNINSSIQRISSHNINISGNGTITTGPRNFINQPNTQINLRVSSAHNGIYLGYDYDTLNTTHCYIASLTGNSYSIYNMTMNTPGMNRSGIGSTHGDITDGPVQHTVYSWINKYNDSTHIFIRFIFFNPKKFLVGNATSSTNVNTSPKIVHSNLFRIFTVWEKEVNGRTALMSSFGDGGLSDISYNGNSLVNDYKLYQNYPNPFNPATKINFDIPSSAKGGVKGETSNVKLIIYSNLGKEMATLVNEELSAGSYSVEFNGTNYPSGIYYYKLEAGNFNEVKKMILVK